MVSFTHKSCAIVARAVVNDNWASPPTSRVSVSAARLILPAVNSPVPSERLSAEAAPSAGVTKVGDVLNTRFVEVVPVVPAAVNPVILLNEVIP